MKNFLNIFIALACLCFSVNAQNAVSSEEAKPKPRKRKNIAILERNSTTIKNPLEMRDHFKRQRLKIGKRSKSYGGFLKDNKYSNLPTINDYPVTQIRIVGVLLGSNRRAIAKVIEGEKLSDETYIVKEGMKIGENDAVVRAIVPGGIVLVEKIRNVYDQDEYIETIIPVSTETI
jgi:Tfp pilus assembly protein PilP